MVKRLKSICFVLCAGFFLLEAFDLFSVSLSAAPQPADTNYDESLVPDYELPPLLMNDSNRLAALKEWNGHRRDELLHLQMKVS